MSKTKITPPLSLGMFVLRHAGLDPASRIFNVFLTWIPAFALWGVGPWGRRPE